MKQTIFKSVTAFVCVLAVCIASSSAFGKLASSITETAKYTPAAGTSAGSGSASVSTSTDGSSADDGSSYAVPDDSAQDIDSATDSGDIADSGAASTDSSSSNISSDSSSSSSTGSSSATAANDPTKYNKAQIVSFYNNAIKTTAKAPKLSVTKSESISIVVDELSLNSDTIKNIINENVLSRYAKPSTESMSFTNGVSSDNTKALDYLPKSRLEAAGVKSASITKSGSNYVVTIVTIAEKTTLEKPTAKYVDQCASPLNLAGVDLGSAIKITQADMYYSGVTLKATVNAKGQLVSSSINQPLKGTGAGKILAFNLSGSVSGGWIQNNTYKY